MLTPQALVPGEEGREDFYDVILDINDYDSITVLSTSVGITRTEVNTGYVKAFIPASGTYNMVLGGADSGDYTLISVDFTI